LSAVNSKPDDVAAKIVDEPDEVNLSSSHAPCEDVGLPHLIGRGSLEEPGLGWVALCFDPYFGDEPLAVQSFSDGFGTARKHQNSSQPLADLFNPEARMRLFKFDDPLFDRFGQFGALRRFAVYGRIL
jgi:hypothetical protein